MMKSTAELDVRYDIQYVRIIVVIDAAMFIEVPMTMRLMIMEEAK